MRGIKSARAEVIQQLENKGHLKRDKGKAGATQILDHPLKSDQIPHIVPIQVVGRVAAGYPILAIQDDLGEFCVEASLARGECFALQICGDSMMDAGINDGDFLIVRTQETALNGEVVIALLDDEATRKTFYRRSSHIELKPENEAYQRMKVSPEQSFKILGKVIAIKKTVEVKPNAANGRCK